MKSTFKSSGGHQFKGKIMIADAIQCYSKKWIASRNRNAQFWFTAKEQEDGVWKIHMHADHVASVDTTTKNPFLLFGVMEKEWVKEISK